MGFEKIVLGVAIIAIRSCNNCMEFAAVGTIIHLVEISHSVTYLEISQISAQ
jgi:hypothetical protein